MLRKIHLPSQGKAIEEYNFKSEAGNSYYIDKSKISFFNEDEDLGQDDEDEEEED